jgi:hypothetical protein
VQSLIQFLLVRLSTDKLLHGLQLIVIAGLESTGVVENISSMIREDEFVLDVVQTALRARSSRSAATDKNQPAQPLLNPRGEPKQIMRLKALLCMRTYPLALSLWTEPVDLWILGGITNSLQNRGLAGICSPNDEDSEPDSAREFGEGLLCVHSTKVL